MNSHRSGSSDISDPNGLRPVLALHPFRLFHASFGGFHAFRYFLENSDATSHVLYCTETFPSWYLLPQARLIIAPFAVSDGTVGVRRKEFRRIWRVKESSDDARQNIHAGIGGWRVTLPSSGEGKRVMEVEAGNFGASDWPISS